MPKQTVYVRDEDLAKWQALENKSTVIHNLLNGNTTTVFGLDEKPAKDKVAIDDILGVSVTLPAERAANGLCKVHGVPLDSRGKCLQKGCKRG